MALCFSDGFDSYSQSSDIARNWTGTANTGWTYNSSAGRLSGGCMQATSNVAVAIPTNVINVVTGTGATSTIGTCCWIKVSTTPSVATIIINHVTATIVSNGGQLQLNTNGLLRLFSGSGTLLATGVTNVCDNSWHWLEMYTTNFTTGATQKCYVDGLQLWNGSFITSIGAQALGSVVFAGAASTTITIDDVIIFDGETAVSPLPSDMPIGPRVITTVRPNSDSSIQFSPDSGVTNYSRVNEQSADEDTSYVQDNNSGHTDQYGYGGLGYSPSSITAVHLVSRVKNSGAGTINFKSRCTSSGTTSDSASTVASSNYNNLHQCLSQDPHTSAAWTPSNLASATFGITVV